MRIVLHGDACEEHGYDAAHFHGLSHQEWKVGKKQHQDHLRLQNMVTFPIDTPNTIDNIPHGHNTF